ncbi:uncharacterized protein E0L32_005113 [Thyridium curvatum]|uniref:CFEM domain-containing protein n=1 Tax=Thyridium curvatum TaxID=1093900 RepID=A0A507BD96_9PEZI|nr:uncharacterized protein E0L32_005113 [Thyridium curvatum]TPX14718.1 hypothetical protein E0L32_005113 [Thyridium curvatum]
MKFLNALVLSAASLVAGQVLLKDYFPQCSITCLENGARSSTTCDPSDGVCVCVFDNYVKIVDAATACVMQACGSDVAVTQIFSEHEAQKNLDSYLPDRQNTILTTLLSTVDKVLPAADTFCKAVTKSAQEGGASATSAPSAANGSSGASASATPTGTAQSSSKPVSSSQAATGAGGSGSQTSSSTAPQKTNGAAKGSAGYVAMLGLGALAVL